MTSAALPSPHLEDATLVEQSLAGDRQAFAQIVGRYQSLVCGLAYSATGSRSHSEDLAQETFVTAWQKLRELHDPALLCGWICGIARNVIHGDLRRLGRQPAHRADALDTVTELASTEPLPTAQAVSNEEMALLWREVSRLPETYREPLILFYRDHRSVEHVAAALGITTDAAMQRLTRGRRLLQERMMVFIESTLQRTNPGPEFILRVHAALPILIGAGPGLAAGTALKGGTAAHGGALPLLLAWAAPLVGVVAAIGISWSDIAHAATPRERRFVARWNLLLWLTAAAFVAALPIVGSLAHSAGLDRRQDWLASAPMVAIWFGFTLVALTLIVFLMRGRNALRRQMLAAGSTDAATPQPVPLSRRIAITAAFLTSLFWVLIFVAWRTGDRTVSLAIAGGVFLLGALALWFGRHRSDPIAEARGGCQFVAFCGIVFLVVLNWRLHVWMAPVYHVDVATMHRLLPPALLFALSAFVVGWTTALVLVTRPDRRR